MLVSREISKEEKLEMDGSKRIRWQAVSYS